MRCLVLKHLSDKLGNVLLDEKDVEIQTKSAQNYKAEWERAKFRAVVEMDR